MLFNASRMGHPLVASDGVTMLKKDGEFAERLSAGTVRYGQARDELVAITRKQHGNGP